jgi:spore coat protein SA
MKSKKVFVVLPGSLPVPDIYGGAIESLVTILLDQNERDKKLNFVFLIKGHENPILLKIFKEKYPNSKIIYINTVIIDKIFSYISIIFNKLRIKNNFVDFFFIINCYRVIGNSLNSIVLIEGNPNHLKLFHFFKFYKKHFAIKTFFHLHSDYTFFDSYSFNNINKLVDRIIVVSYFLKQRLISKFNINPEKFYVLKNTIDQSLFSKEVPVTTWKSVSGKFNLGYIGRISPEKGIYNLLDAFSNLTNKSLRLYIAGSPSFKNWTSNNFYKGFLDKVKLDERVKYLGYIDRKNLSSFYKKVDLVLFPSTGPEAAGLIILEALFFGVPVLASQNGGIKEYMDNKFGYFFKNTDNILDIKNDLLRILSNNNDLVKRKQNIVTHFMLTGAQTYYNEFLEAIDYA